MVACLSYVIFLSLHFNQALSDCVKDLLSPFHSDTIDLVAGIDAMGFILGKNTNQILLRRKISGGLRAVALTLSH